MKILIVDDSPATLEIVRRALEKFGYRKLLIRKASSVKLALREIGNWRPDIVLTDWHMPDMSGLTLLHAIKKRQLNMTVAMITTVDEQAKINEALQAGARFVLSKPFSDQQLHDNLLPLVQGTEESEVILEQVEINGQLALPKLGQLERLIHKQVDKSLVIQSIKPQDFDETKVPCVMAIYEDRNNQKVRAVGLLDVYATCVLASSQQQIAPQEIHQAIHQHILSSDILESCKETLNATAFAFLDKRSRMSLRVKTVKFIGTPFKKLESLYQTPLDSRIDFSCQREGMALGKVLLVGF
ncbi:response regulator [Pseudoalteromonas byunsanensis]|uniref:Response regulator n=1 Tax=Pseudoalteromonas byunsanensis TaxID=327939 RepID=A0A1S1N2R0_9GAMM|nr:response regulator [Pseudoalteromonas byunsanensis]OHU93670.1 response regulator [Pseudoalteromonas byunsanensis]